MPEWHALASDLIGGSLASHVITILSYLDPGTGSYAIQIILATLFGGMFAFKQSWSELKAWVTLRIGARSDPADPAQERRRIGIRPHNIARPALMARRPPKSAEDRRPPARFATRAASSSSETEPSTDRSTKPIGAITTGRSTQASIAR